MAKPNIPIAENPWGKKLYVRSCMGTATDSNNDGQRALSPLLSVKRAIELAADYDTIIVGEGHVEVVKEPWTITKCVDVQCRGRGCHRPLFSFLGAGAMYVEADGFTLWNARSELGGEPASTRLSVSHATSFVDLGIGISPCQSAPYVDAESTPPLASVESEASGG